ncbi:ATP-binding protein [Cellulosimicrobium arenosum]|uniref:ATP-binding protein n=1 Tax=Cellulosimicrobium arenosum TaxID=2708133 RepID=A0A927G9G3_9MICO|nr:ATP-binding protein [Cellulosimicrobium arenosum]MBD8079423.1 ATP-binding protein [Cellulosimicrobium arenosum]
MTVAYAEVPHRFVEIASWDLRAMTQLTQLRADLHRTLTANPMPQDHRLDSVPERLVLVASELATNALRHGNPPIRVRLLSDGREIAVDVIDHSPEQAPVVAGRRAPGAGGFGLVLACRAARDVGWFRSGVGEKHVWARFDVPAYRTGASARSALTLAN